MPDMTQIGGRGAEGQMDKRGEGYPPRGQRMVAVDIRTVARWHGDTVAPWAPWAR